jgi:hypothetical protein
MKPCRESGTDKLLEKPFRDPTAIPNEVRNLAFPATFENARSFTSFRITGKKAFLNSLTVMFRAS